MLAIYAHPDDPEISAGGTLAAWADAGTKIHVLLTTRGDKGTSDPDADTEALARLRVDESEAAGKVLGLAGHHQLDYSDGELPDDLSLREHIVRFVRELKPDAIVTHDPTSIFFGDSYFNHRDHRVTGFAALDAIAPAAGNPHYFPQHLRDGLDVHEVRAAYLSASLEPNCWVDITRTQERKIDALFCHTSQLMETGEWFREFLRERAEEGGRAAGVTYAEGFRRLVFG